MPVDNTPTPRTRALAHELRNVKKDSRLTVRELAAKMGMSTASAGAWVSGRRVPNVEQVSALLAHCGVTGAQRERIMDIARRATDPNWLTAGLPGVSQQLSGVLECESTAKRIIEWSPDLVPGLGQTGDYARAVMRNGADAAVRVRLGRRDVLTRRNGAEFQALIGVCAITDVIGSPAVMADQLRDLTGLAARSNVDLRVVPRGIGFHPGLQGPFVIYEFDNQPPVVHFEHYRSGAFLLDESDVADYRNAASRVAEIAMTPADSAEFIAEVIKRLEKQ